MERDAAGPHRDPRHGRRAEGGEETESALSRPRSPPIVARFPDGSSVLVSPGHPLLGARPTAVVSIPELPHVRLGVGPRAIGLRYTPAGHPLLERRTVTGRVDGHEVSVLGAAGATTEREGRALLTVRGPCEQLTLLVDAGWKPTPFPPTNSSGTLQRGSGSGVVMMGGGVPPGYASVRRGAALYVEGRRAGRVTESLSFRAEDLHADGKRRCWKQHFGDGPAAGFTLCVDAAAVTTSP